MARSTAVDPGDEVGALARAVATGINRRVEERLRQSGFPDVRTLHRDVVLGLLAGDTTVIALAGRLSVSAQALSKAVLELEGSGCVQRGRDPGDGRVRPIVLTFSAARRCSLPSVRARTAEARELRRWLGTRDHAELVRLLQHAAEHLRGLPPP